MEFIAAIEKGGILMYPILLCSFISFTILFERLFSLRKSKITPAVDSIFHLAKLGNKDNFATEIKKRDDYLSDILEAVIDDDTEEDPVKLTEMYGKIISLSVYKSIY